MEITPPPRALVVSIHDVSPMTWQASRSIVERLHKAGVHQTSLLVVPDHHHRGHFLSNTGFCEWLAACEEDGHEVVIHGYYHTRERKKTEGIWQKLMTRTYTADEGEFYDITGEQALELVTKAQGEFARIKMHPPGFIAPAWLLSEAGEQALTRASIQYTTRLGNVLHLKSGMQHDSASMVYSVRTGLRRILSLAWNASLYRRLKANPLLRVSIHPPDLNHPQIWRQILKYIALALEDRTPMTYSKWVSANPGFQTTPHTAHVQG